jgi:peptide/nickel transport system permease protein
MAGEERDPESIARLRAIYRLDDPIVVQYFAWLGQVMQGEFGRSLRTGEPVLGLILQKLPVTLQLAAASMIVALAIGLPAGIIAAVRKGTSVDYAASAVALSGLSIPNFWLGIVMILVFAVELRWLPASGYVPFFSDPLGAIETLIMPAFVLGTGLAAFIMRHTRSAMLEVLRSDYVRTARAKGLDESVVINKHALRNALIPVITLSTILFGELLAGAVLTEQVFTIPGFGKLIVDAVFNRDYGVVQGVVLCTAIGFIVMNLVADLLYIIVNPRLRGR